jgi:hypothetical protein
MVATGRHRFWCKSQRDVTQTGRGVSQLSKDRGGFSCCVKRCVLNGGDKSTSTTEMLSGGSRQYLREIGTICSGVSRESKTKSGISTGHRNGQIAFSGKGLEWELWQSSFKGRAFLT